MDFIYYIQSIIYPIHSATAKLTENSHLNNFAEVGKKKTKKKQGDM